LYCRFAVMYWIIYKYKKKVDPLFLSFVVYVNLVPSLFTYPVSKERLTTKCIDANALKMTHGLSSLDVY